MRSPTPSQFKNIVTADRGRIFWNKQRQAFPSVFPDLSGLPMSGTTFRGWNFSGVDFTECDLSGSRFIGCDFRGACFHDVVMEGEHSGDSLEADLDGAFFEACDLRSSLMPPRWAREFEALRADAKLAELYLSLPLLRLRNVADFGVCECGALHTWANAEPAPTVCSADNARPSGGGCGCGQEIEAARLSRKPEDLRTSVEAGRLKIRLGAHDAIDPDDSREITVAFRDDLAAIEATAESLVAGLNSSTRIEGETKMIEAKNDPLRVVVATWLDDALPVDGTAMAEVARISLDHDFSRFRGRIVSIVRESSDRLMGFAYVAARFAHEAGADSVYLVDPPKAKTSAQLDYVVMRGERIEAETVTGGEIGSLVDRVLRDKESADVPLQMLRDAVFIREQRPDIGQRVLDGEIEISEAMTLVKAGALV